VKHRVIESAGNFYPQVQYDGKEWTFFQFEGMVICYSTLEDAKKYCESQKHTVVWEEA
jgi:hypothetical protein